METNTKPKPHLFFLFPILLVYLPILLSLAVMRARWYGWLTAAFSFYTLLRMHGRPFWHTWRIALCFLSAYMVAFIGLYIARPNWEYSLSAQIGSGLVRTFTSLPPHEQELGMSLLAENNWQPPDGYTLEKVTLAHSTLQLLSPAGSQSRYTVLQLHGGAFVTGLLDLYQQFALHYSQQCDQCMVATLDYRLAPEWPYPAQQEDTLDAWRYLTDTLGYEAGNILVVGDSAGGNLALSLGLRLRDNGESMPMAFVCLSPWADLSNSGVSHIENATVDPSFGISAADFHGQPVGVSTTYPDGLNARDPYLSPSFGDYAGFPPMLLQAGSIEVLLSDSEMVYENARDHGVACTLTVYKGMFHVFQGAMDLLPESKLAWEEIGAFIGKQLSE